MKRVLVVGDGCKDVFQYGNCDRLSPEAPVPVFSPTELLFNGGMAVNVFENLKALDVSCDIITDSGITKTRIVDEVSNQMLLRIDVNDKVKQISSQELESVEWEEYDAIVISDYNKGFLSQADIQYITSNHDLVFLDTKRKIGKWASNVKFIKINEREYKNNYEFLDLYYHNGLIVTLGKDGARYGKDIYDIVDKHDVRDLSGAGDTFLAGLVAEYIKNNDICKAIKFANKCASWVVSQKGVVSVSLKDIEND